MLFRSNKKDSNKNRKSLIIIAGFAGSGKTTVGKMLATELNYLYLDKDTLTRSFTDKLLEEKGIGKQDRESDFYVKEVNHLEYGILLKVAIENLELGNGAVLSAPFIRQISNAEWLSQLKDKILFNGDIKIKVIWVKASRDIERVRLIERNAERDENKLRKWSEYCESIAHLTPHPDYNFYTFNNNEDSKQNINEKLNELIKWITK